MNRTDLQKLSNIRIMEARALLQAGHASGAYYLAGYGVECALKACIARQTRRHDFPNLRLVRRSYTHDLEELLRVTGLEAEFEQGMQADRKLRLNRSVVKDWNETARYESQINMFMATHFVMACTGRPNGVLPWIRKRW